ncbi:MAG: CbiX/SirB N-terminal domain-containing protein [Bryobacteraceae bacterium]
MTGIVVFAHGSSVGSANEAVRNVVKETFPKDLVEAAFLEQGQPDLRGAVDRLLARGASRVLIIPYFLTLGLHLQRDLPRIVAELSGIHKNMEIQVTPPLDGHPALSQILLDRAREAGVV